MKKSTPSGTEDRLRRALEARAEQVTPQSLRRVVPPPAAPRRRWVPAVLASAAAVTLVAGGSLLLRSGDERPDTPPVAGPTARVQTSGTCRREAQLVTDALAGKVERADVDGDGSPDDVVLAVDAKAPAACRAFVGVRTAKGTYSAPFDASAVPPAGAIKPRIIGFPDLGDPGAEIVVDTAAGADRAVAQLFTLTGTGLVRVPAPAFEDGNFVVEGGGVTNPQGAGCTADRALVLSMASAVKQGTEYEVTRQTYGVTGDDLRFSGPTITTRTVPAARLTAEFPEFGGDHFGACPPR